MNLHGLQKTTLLDFPGHIACTVFLGGCDFRCPFCHNYELADGTSKPVTNSDTLLSFLEKRKGLLDGVAFTGGEPLLSSGLPELMKKIHEMGFSIKLDTNGYHPERLRSVLDDGLVDYIAMDIKNSPQKYAITCGVKNVDFDKIRESISILMDGKLDYEFRTTVVKPLHELSDFEQIGKEIQGAKRYFLQRFTDRDTVPFENLTAPTPDEMNLFANAARTYVPSILLRGVE